MRNEDDIEELDFSEKAMVERAFKKFFTENAGLERDPEDDEEDSEDATLVDDINIDIDESDLDVEDEDDE